MYILSPVAYPIALLLDWVVGKQEGLVLRKSRLKTLISLQKSLESDEVILVSAALDLKEQWVSSIMTPISHTFMLGGDVLLNDLVRHDVWASGYNQIPVHAPGDATKFIGVLSTKDLIIDQVEERQAVKELNLAPLPVMSPDLNCLEILEFFRGGKKQMVLVTECGTVNGRALGIITRSSVIENLIKE
jgi:metal transporter CNNM